jgi:hypothetical protein
LAKKAFIELSTLKNPGFLTQYLGLLAFKSSAKIWSLFYPLAYPIKRRDKNK